MRHEFFSFSRLIRLTFLNNKHYVFLPKPSVEVFRNMDKITLHGALHIGHFLDINIETFSNFISLLPSFQNLFEVVTKHYLKLIISIIPTQYHTNRITV